MPIARKTKWALFAAILAMVIAGVGIWRFMTSATGPVAPSSNAIMVLTPYWYNGTWVFDDPAVGLKREPFVAGVPEMIDVLVKDIPDAKEGFRLLFSANEFPGHQKKLTWVRGAAEGNYYKFEDPPMEGWICPALFKYYAAPPKVIYVKAESLRR